MEVDESIRTLNNNSLIIPNIFAVTEPLCRSMQPADPQTDFLLRILGLPHVWTHPSSAPSGFNREQHDIAQTVVDGSRCINEADSVPAETAPFIDKNEICLDY